MSEAVAANQNVSIPGPGHHKEETMDLVVYWRSISKRKWSIFGLALLVTLLAGVTVFLMTPVYRSAVTLMVEQNKGKVVSIEEVYSGVGGSREYFQTQAEILKSRSLATRVIDKLKLAAHPEFDPRQQPAPFWHALLKPVGIVLEEPDKTEAQVREAVLNKFMKQMTVEPVRLSQLVKISFESTDRETAATIANAIADTFIENDMEARFQMTKRASDWLNERLAGLKKGLEQSERTLQEYRDRERIVDTKGLAQAGATKQIEDLTKTLIESRQKRAEAENAFNQIKDAKEFNSLPVVMRNPLVARLKELENESEKKVAELSQRYGPQHVKMIQAEGELKQMRENTRRQIETVVASLTKEYEVARANEQAVVRTMGEAKGFVQGINRKEFQLGALEREVATNRQIYDMFVNRFKETSAASDMQSNVVARVVDPAMPSDKPVKPNKQQIIAIAFVLGIFLGVVVALLLEVLDNTVKSADDVEEKLGQPVLTMLPVISGRAARKAAGTHYLDEPKSVFAEAIRTARTGVLLSAIDTPHKTLLITSSVPNEGKTTFAVNLALAHAQTKKVLLIDADMRRPSLAKQLKLDASNPGLSTLVSGAAKFDDCVQAVEGSTLHVISSGPIPPNPLELILTHRFKEVLKMCEKEYEIIIMDSPPVQLVSDAVVLSKMATGVLFVIKADSTPYQLARRGIRALLEVDATLFGVTLNQLDFKKADRYYGAQTGYAKYNYEAYYTKAS